MKSAGFHILRVGMGITFFRDDDNAVSKSVVINFTINEPFISVLRGVALGEDLLVSVVFWIVIVVVSSGAVFGGVWWHRKRKLAKVGK